MIIIITINNKKIMTDTFFLNQYTIEKENLSFLPLCFLLSDERFSPLTAKLDSSS